VPSPASAPAGGAPRSVSRSGVAALAAAGGGAVREDEDGMTTIDFTGQGTPVIPPFSTAPVTVSRLFDGAIGSHRARAASAVSSASSAASSAASDVAGRGGDAVHGLVQQGQGMASQAIHGAADAVGDALGLPGEGAAGADPEEMYEQVLQRLRRDLIAELEQSGQLLRDNL
jgi:hypothetical protein